MDGPVVRDAVSYHANDDNHSSRQGRKTLGLTPSFVWFEHTVAHTRPLGLWPFGANLAPNTTVSLFGRVNS